MTIRKAISSIPPSASAAAGPFSWRRTRRLAVAAALTAVMIPAAQAADNTKGVQQSNEITKSQDTSNTQSMAVPANAKVGVDDAMMRSADRNLKDWTLHGRTYSNQRYSPLAHITDDNIKMLKAAAIVQTGMTASFETTPIVVDGVMYVTTPTVDQKMKIMALDATNGELYWETTYDVGLAKTCCGPVNRGVAVAYGDVYVTTLDAKLIALDAKTGKKDWETQLADPREGYSETMAPQVYDGMVIVGSSGGEWPIRGFVAAVDSKTGKEKWRWQATDPKSFEGDSWKSGGGMVWTTPAIDPERGLVVFSTGNPNPDLDGSQRKGDNLYTDSIVALDVHSGKLKWYYQEVKHDVWDYDAVSNVVLMDVKENGKTVPAAAEAGKVGWLFVVNRDTGKLIRKSDPLVKMSDNMFSTPTKEGVQMLPGANGGAEWSPPAYSPETHLLYAMEMNQLMTFTTDNATQTIPGQLRLGSTFKNVKGDSAVQNGVLDAVNVDTGKVAWKYDAKQPLIGGVLATGGNLVFTGEGNGWFDAFDAKTGKKLWHYYLGAGVNAPPITYEVKGEQYIAVAAGGNFQLGYPLGDAIAIFKLAPIS